jgi:hypothetical protein
MHSHISIFNFKTAKVSLVGTGRNACLELYEDPKDVETHGMASIWLGFGGITLEQLKAVIDEGVIRQKAQQTTTVSTL